MLTTAVDLFAGAGGFSTGARKAGIRVVWAANHERLAVATHSRNHPETQHACQDLQLADWTRLPDHDAEMASPCCQGHSKARGRRTKEARDDAQKSRSTAWCVYSCAAINRPKAIVVENVEEFQDWDESDDPENTGSVFRTWRDLICRIGPGYHFSSAVIDAADLGVPQHRERLFMVFTRKDLTDGPLKLSTPNLPHVPAASILEDSRAVRWNRIQDKASSTRGFVRRTQERRFKPGTPFLIPYYGKTLETGLGRDINRPLGTITTRARYGVVSDCHRWMRMLTIREYQRAMAFPESYALPAVQAAAIKQLGNAVCPPVAAWVLEQVKAHFTSQGRRVAA